jgi:hypothetical protein
MTVSMLVLIMLILRSNNSVLTQGVWTAQAFGHTHGSTLLNIDEIETGSILSNDELGLLSSKVVDVPSQ